LVVLFSLTAWTNEYMTFYKFEMRGVPNDM